MAEKEASSHVRSEDQLSQKFDRCLSDATIKFVAGLSTGIVFSVLFLKRRPWPVAFGAGLGLGMAYSNCQHDFMNPNYFHGRIVKKGSKEDPTK
ncbi:hypothetical protein LSH36_76g02000 [Paralvinella palmiformis]|uniref:MICOS complex subunit MIC10 n=1 Tax=Paralvinella palmiformis TaxID=53620 RepID=A0AAD9K460_9ANNE|nr:hypothetical protein LSH36_76g02000 [Paralvinella palmiformis]